MNNRHTTFLLLSLLQLFFFSCQRPFLSDDEAATEAQWEMVDFESERQILGMHATPFEYQLITDNEFARFDGDNQLLEKRPLAIDNNPLGYPVLSDNTFVRLTTNENAQQVISFHLTRNPGGIQEVIADDLAGSEDSFVEVEFRAHQLGAFSDDGTIFMLPIKVFPGRYYALLLFEVLHNIPHNAFTSIEMVKRINLTELGTDLSRLNTLRFVNGNFYVTSQEGAWRVSPSGESEKIFTQWMLDAFSYQGDLYITGLNSFDLHKSTDNGRNWERLNQNSELKVVTNANEIILSQPIPGMAYQLSDNDLLKTHSIVFPSGYSTQDIIYFGAFFFAGKYYFGLDRTVHFTDVIVAE